MSAKPAPYPIPWVLDQICFDCPVAALGQLISFTMVGAIFFPASFLVWALAGLGMFILTMMVDFQRFKIEGYQDGLKKRSNDVAESGGEVFGYVVNPGELNLQGLFRSVPSFCSEANKQ